MLESELKAKLGMAAAFSCQHPLGVALFPGAFRPPHKAHFETVQYLASRPDVDEVVIIITSRSRQVPGTNLALAPSVAQQIWNIYLQGLDKVRLEVAPGSAVKHALGYFNRSRVGQRLFFCAGSKDLESDTGRFSRIRELSDHFDMVASVIPSPVTPLRGGATSIRAQLAKGEEGFEAFMEALPGHLTTEQSSQVWRICRQGLLPMTALAEERIRQLFQQEKLGHVVTIESAKSGKTDEVLKVGLESGEQIFVKTAHDTPKAAHWGNPTGLKPRRRVYVERTALKWLASQIPEEVEVPRVIKFDNATRTLVLTGVLLDGESLQQQMEKSRFDSEIASKIADFLAFCHRFSKPVPAFWGGEDADYDHWRTLLHLSTAALEDVSLPERIALCQSDLQRDSLRASRPGFFHLDFTPQNIRLNANGIGIIDFECCCSVGDSAFDLGCLLGHYWFWGMTTLSERACQNSVETMMDRYRRQVGDLDPKWVGRVYAFAGATVLRLSGLEKRQWFERRIKPRLLMWAQDQLDNHPSG